MPKGRPTRSEIRQNIVDILFHMKSAYGYEIYKVYKRLFAPVSMRVIYYHLKKGVALDEFKVEKKERTSGNYSWGESAEKIYYGLGPKAKVSNNEKVNGFFKKA